jgi:hypothetical protein
LADTMITMLEGIHRDWRVALTEKYRMELIRATYGVQVRNVYDAKMYEERACLDFKGKIPN